MSLAAGDGKKRVCFIFTAAGDSLSAIDAVTEVFADRGDVDFSMHYVGTELHEAVAMRDGAQAWWVEPSPGGGYHDEPIPPRRL